MGGIRLRTLVRFSLGTTQPLKISILCPSGNELINANSEGEDIVKMMDSLYDKTKPDYDQDKMSMLFNAYS